MASSAVRPGEVEEVERTKDVSPFVFLFFFRSGHHLRSATLVSLPLSHCHLTFQKLANVLDELRARQARRSLLFGLGLFGRGRSHVFSSASLIASSFSSSRSPARSKKNVEDLLSSSFFLSFFLYFLANSLSLSFKMARSIRADSSRVLWRLASSPSSAATRCAVEVAASPSAAAASAPQRLIVAASASTARFSSARSAASSASPSSLRAPSSCEPLRRSNVAR